LKAAEPLVITHGRFDSVSTLFTTVGSPYKPMAAGKYGGLIRGNPRLPSRLSSSAVSSPQMYAPAPGWTTTSTEKPDPKMSRPTAPCA
jgi:hypothetical protein